VISLPEQLKLVDVKVLTSEANATDATVITFTFPITVARNQKIKCKSIGVRVVLSDFPSAWAEYKDKKDVLHALSETFYWQGYSHKENVDQWLADDIKEILVYVQQNEYPTKIYVEPSLEIYE